MSFSNHMDRDMDDTILEGGLQYTVPITFNINDNTHIKEGSAFKQCVDGMFRMFEPDGTQSFIRVNDGFLDRYNQYIQRV
jgi:hypothetical protein